MNAKRLFCLMILLGWLAASCAPAASPADQTHILSENIADIVAKFREEIPRQMQEANIPGLAIAVVDDQGILWEEGFGYTDWDRRTPVTPSTIFSIQSMSKSFTATAAMFAAQDGLVDLDEPIITYLPNFTVHSIFEEHPERKMTLRMLLSHTAGFPHDTWYGNNNYQPADFSFEKHIASISDTWLMYPVGTRYSYSNEDVDLAGYILQVRSGMPFIQYVQKKVLDPFGMKNSTLDIYQVRATSTRAIGHTDLFLPMRPPVDLLMIPSGGVWTSVEDMARYLQFHINKGTLDGKRLLEEDLAETMYTPPNPAARNEKYALGVYSHKFDGTRYIQHGGGGFGFTNYMAWYPDLKLGAVVISNAVGSDENAVNLCENVLYNIISSNVPLYHQRFISATQVAPTYPQDTKGDILTDEALRNLIESKALPINTAAQKRWNDYAGTYFLTPGDPFVISTSNGKLAWTYHGGESMFMKNSTLTEVEPGLLISENGNTFDLRGSVLMVDNIRLVKANPQALLFKIVLYTFCALLFLSALFIWPVRSFHRRVRNKSGQAYTSSAAPKGSPWPVLVSVMAALASLFSLFCLAIIALGQLVYYPWPSPWPDLLWWQSAFLRLPFASLLLGLGIGLLAVLALRSHAGRIMRWYYLVVGVALLVFNGVILL